MRLSKVNLESSVTLKYLTQLERGTVIPFRSTSKSVTNSIILGDITRSWLFEGLIVNLLDLHHFESLVKLRGRLAKPPRDWQTGDHVRTTERYYSLICQGKYINARNAEK